MVDLPGKDIGCHRTGFTQKCRDLVVDGVCTRWMQVQGKHPNTGEDINRSDCIDNWTPFLLMENSQMQRQTGAAVESLRNNERRDFRELATALQQMAQAVQDSMEMRPALEGREMRDVNAYIAPSEERHDGNCQ